MSNWRFILYGCVLCSIGFHGAMGQGEPSPQKTASPTPRAITIETVPGRLMFSPSSVHVQPGERLRLTVKNNGPAVCNFVICSEGENNWKQAADFVIDLGPTMLARNFNPGPPLVTHATALLRSGEEATLNWRAPAVEGVYPFLSTIPGHTPLMRGEFIVCARPVGISQLGYRYYEGNWKGDPDFDELEPTASGDLTGNLIDFENIPGVSKLLDAREAGAKSAIILSASLNLPFQSEYTFALASSQPAKLTINDDEIVKHGGTFGVTRFGKVELGSPEPTDELPTLELQVIGDGAFETPGLKWHGAAGSVNLSVAKQFVIAPIEKPVAVTLPMADASALALGVAASDGASYCFDPDTLSVRYAWTGGFVDARTTTDDGSRRLGGNVQPLGELIPLGADSSFPLRIGRLAEDAPEVQYLGHSYGRTRKGDEDAALMFKVGDYTVAQKVSINATSEEYLHAVYAFRIEPPPPPGVPVVFSVDPSAVELKTKHGFARNGIAVLSVRDGEKDLVVELHPRRN